MGLLKGIFRERKEDNKKQIKTDGIKEKVELKKRW